MTNFHPAPSETTIDGCQNQEFNGGESGKFCAIQH